MTRLYPAMGNSFGKINRLKVKVQKMHYATLIIKEQNWLCQNQSRLLDKLPLVW